MASGNLEKIEINKGVFIGFCFKIKRIKHLEESYEEQGILEDGDTDHRDGADSTRNYARRNELYGVTKEGHPQ